jgi:RNA polymerase sigma-70 factor (ECF subfamily)
VSQARTGDADAWPALYRRYHGMVFRTAYLLIGDSGRAEEPTQDVFVQVFRSLDRYAPERGAFTTWLHQITVNLCLNARRHRLWRWLSLDLLSGEDAAPTGSTKSPCIVSSPG